MPRKMTEPILAAAFLCLTSIASAAVPPPTALVIVACRVDDLTGQPGRHDPALAAKDWRDLELKIIDGEYSCKREVLSLEDGSLYQNVNDLIPLNANFADWTQCSRVGVVQAQAWNEKHKGWATVAVGCPVPIVNGDGRIIGYKLPECPSTLPGTNNPMRCKFDASEI